ncbi:hypothetical protein E2C01_036990 [Portunus trituberculatus]|uniref:Uncharacterized protein n=1 Tax=Portunus trituberculatus TaxID=210409 RepID=A0A5B7FCX2_PORTR|nr:hypothetical protein [Portunus trituberculatus]
MSTTATRVGGRGWGRGSRCGQASNHDPDPVLLGGPNVQTPRVPRHQKGMPAHMTDAEGSLQDPCVPRGTEGSPHPIFNFGGASGVADMVPACQTIHGINLRRTLCVGSWNVLSLSENTTLQWRQDKALERR